MGCPEAPGTPPRRQNGPRGAGPGCFDLRTGMLFQDRLIGSSTGRSAFSPACALRTGSLAQRWAIAQTQGNQRRIPTASRPTARGGCNKAPPSKAQAQRYQHGRRHVLPERGRRLRFGSRPVSSPISTSIPISMSASSTVLLATALFHLRFYLPFITIPISGHDREVLSANALAT